MSPRFPDLPNALDCERLEFEGRAGRLSYYIDGPEPSTERPPLLLVHSINAAGSAYEIKPIFEAMRDTHRVYAPDLPGFGFSDRSERRYNVRLYVDAVKDMTEHVVAKEGCAPIDIVALSLASEFVARAAIERPETVRSLTMITPTGFSARTGGSPGPEGSTREVPGLYGIFTFPLWRRGFFGLLTSRKSIRFFLEKTFGSKEIDQGLLDYDYLTTHQPGADRAPFAFVSGRLFSRDIRGVYEQLTIPVWMPHGTKGDFKDFSKADWVRDRRNWMVTAYNTGALPQFEESDRFAAELRVFLDEVGKPIQAEESPESPASTMP